jgi:hypothetical protein
VHPLKLAICILVANYELDKTVRVSKSRGYRYASLLGASVCGCDFIEFCWKLSERKAILMICNPSLQTPVSVIYCLPAGRYIDLFLSLALPRS